MTSQAIPGPNIIDYQHSEDIISWRRSLPIHPCLFFFFSSTLSSLVSFLWMTSHDWFRFWLIVSFRLYDTYRMLELGCVAIDHVPNDIIERKIGATENFHFSVSTAKSSLLVLAIVGFPTFLYRKKQQQRTHIWFFSIGHFSHPWLWENKKKSIIHDFTTCWSDFFGEDQSGGSSPCLLSFFEKDNTSCLLASRATSTTQG